MGNLHDICDFVKKLNQKLNLGDTIDGEFVLIEK